MVIKYTMYFTHLNVFFHVARGALPVELTSW